MTRSSSPMSVRVCGSGRSFAPITHVTAAHITQPIRAPTVSRRRPMTPSLNARAQPGRHAGRDDHEERLRVGGRVGLDFFEGLARPGAGRLSRAR